MKSSKSNTKRTQTRKCNKWTQVAQSLMIAHSASDENIWYAHVQNNKMAYCEIKRILNVQENQSDIVDANTVIYVPLKNKRFELYTVFSTIESTGKEWVFNTHKFIKDNGTFLPESVKVGAYGSMMCKI